MITEEIKKLMVWEQFPKEQHGGQSCGIINAGSTLACKEMEFSISCNGSRSQMKNRQFCVAVFELYLDEFHIIKLTHE